MPLVATHDLEPGDKLSRQVYNGLDCMLTFEVLEALRGLQGNADHPIYDFERALQAPLLEIMLRGFKVDEYSRREAIQQLENEIAHYQSILNEFAAAIWDKPLNPNSPKQLIEFFYGKMRLPEVWISKKGQSKLSTDREALEKLDVYFHARPIIACIFAIRDRRKQLGVLRTEVSPVTGRMHTSYNIAGTESGRLSSSYSADGTGTNLQNITGALRYAFVADEGKKICGIDLEQAESREVGWQCGVLFDDWSYLDACYAGDLHTLACRLIWPDLAWTGDLKRDRKLADENFYREYSRRDMAKRGGHGSNYLGTPFTMARHLKVPVKLMEDFQRAYFAAFSGIPKWHRWTAQQLQTTQRLVTPFGRERHFFGRARDDATLREAVAFVPQSSTADRMNLILYRLWKHFGPRIELLAQVHDAVYFQFDPRKEDEQELIPEALALFHIEMTHKGHSLVVPGEAKIGWNWGSEVTQADIDRAKGKKPRLNPDGLKKFKLGTPDTRTRTSILERSL